MEELSSELRYRWASILIIFAILNLKMGILATNLLPRGGSGKRQAWIVWILFLKVTMKHTRSGIGGEPAR